METVGRHFSQRAAVPPASSVEPKNPITTLRIELAYKIDQVRAIYILRDGLGRSRGRLGAETELNSDKSMAYAIVTAPIPPFARLLLCPLYKSREARQGGAMGAPSTSDRDRGLTESDDGKQGTFFVLARRAVAVRDGVESRRRTGLCIGAEACARAVRGDRLLEQHVLRRSWRAAEHGFGIGEGTGLCVHCQGGDLCAHPGVDEGHAGAAVGDFVDQEPDVAQGGVSAGRR